MIKDSVLKILEQNKGTPVSGLTIGKELGVSRNAVWKSICQLKEEGFSILSIPNRGYRLDESEDVIRPEAISALLSTRYLGRNFEVLDTIDSTNTYLKRISDTLAGKHGYTVVALRQTAGKGRMQRQFYSPAQRGVYMSFYLEPHFTFQDISLVTVIAVVAVCRAIEETAGFAPDVKWVNDVLFHDKKLCGILTEASVEAESGQIKYLVTGIGININKDESLPEELQNIVGALNEFSEHPCNRNLLIASILNHFEALFELYLSGNRTEILREYKKHLCVFHREYNIVSLNGSYPAVPVDIDEDAHLIVRDQNGVLHTLNSGEISIRKKNPDSQ